MHRVLRLSIPLVLLVACNSGQRTEGGATTGSSTSVAGSNDVRASCVKVRDHLVNLIASAYVANPETTFDGLDRSDPQIAEGLDASLTRETFAAFLASEPGKAWLQRQKQRAIDAPSMASTVDKCAREASQANLDCWLGSRNLPAFQLCPEPGA